MHRNAPREYAYLVGTKNKIRELISGYGCPRFACTRQHALIRSHRYTHMYRYARVITPTRRGSIKKDETVESERIVARMKNTNGRDSDWKVRRVKKSKKDILDRAFLYADRRERERDRNISADRQFVFRTVELADHAIRSLPSRD